VAWYGLGGRKNESSYYDISTVAWENNTVKLNAPVLNISAFTDDGTEVDHSNSSYVLPISWVRGNETVDITWVENNGKCQTVGVGYFHPVSIGPL
jgi:hypothetical protein